MKYLQNQSIGDAVEWIVDDLHFSELIRQEYGGNNCVFSAGTVEGHPVDTLYLKWQKDGDEGSMLLLRPDEMAAVAWVCNGALWSKLMEIEDEPQNT